MNHLYIITAVAIDRSVHLGETADSVAACARLLAACDLPGLQWSICVDGKPAPTAPHDDSSKTLATAADRSGIDPTLSHLGAQMGVSVARNAALAVSGAGPGDWVITLDGDDLLEPVGIASLATHLTMLDHTSSPIAWVGSNRVEMDGTHGAHWLGTKKSFRPGELNESYLHPFVIHPNSVAYRASAIDTAGGWPASPGGEDLALWLRVARTHPGQAIPTVTLRYRRWEGQVTANGAFAGQRKLRYGYYTRCDLLAGRDPLEMRFSPPASAPTTAPIPDPSVALPKVRVRPCRPTDASTLRTLRLRMLDTDPASFNTDPLTAHRRLPDYWQHWADEAALAQQKVIFFAQDPPSGAQVTTPVYAMIAADLTDGVAHVGALWVDPSRRQRGAADALLDAIETWAHDVRAHTLELGVAEDNAAAIRIYHRRHYADTGHRKETRYDHQELVMAKPVGT